ncbi:iron-sulfur cluster repair di-iron protein [Sphingobacterium luzhongxinii]|uniref:iron-sulfur cluster repair di-iron protein n=1 Tax=Sphingobacterium luzhongxinii TaxID=2654181 RepID=UPI0013DBB497|nr:iron-sulfur cluster repair di-iron protein [Sphingobacterium sp. xlx-73]
MIKTTTLDVTTIEPRFKHPTIFEHFDSLVEGEGFEILNDHDPKPLYYQLLGERGNIFTWEYLEHGPEWWRVRIYKPIKKDKNHPTVGEIAAQDIKKGEVFKKLGIDFCCGGKKTIQEAAQSIGMDPEQLQYELENAKSSSSAGIQHDFNSWEPGFLADYITNVHHHYIREQGPIITQLANKVAMRHGSERKELFKLATGIHDFMEDLYKHILHEDQKIFTVVKQLSSGTDIDLKELESAIQYLEEEHEQAGENLSLFRTWTDNYKLPENACNSYTYLFEKIKEFENDLLQHIHLENNILFPKALALN